MLRRLLLVLAFLVTLTLAAAAPALAHPAAQPAVPSASFGTNLIVNGGAEAAEGSTGGAQVVVPGWSATTGRFTAIQYGGASGFPDFTSPGPPNRGFNFFGGGVASLSSAYQDIDLAPLAETIDGGTSYFGLSGYLGGYKGDGDQTTLTALFRGADGAVLATVTLDPVRTSDRNYRTGMILRQTVGEVPPGTRSVRVQMQMTRSAGDSNDGYADDVSLVLSATRPTHIYLPRVRR